MAAPRNENLRDKILDAAVRLLREQPDISLAEVAAAAGVSKGTLYYHYKSKAELYLDIGERYWAKLSDDLLAWVDNPEKDTSIPRLVRYTISYGVFDESGPVRLHLFADALSNADTPVPVRRSMLRNKPSTRTSSTTTVFCPINLNGLISVFIYAVLNAKALPFL